MKITRRQLRKIISESFKTMREPEMEIVRKALSDPGVDERIKSLIRSDDEAETIQAMTLLDALSLSEPDKYGDYNVDRVPDPYLSSEEYRKKFDITHDFPMIQEVLKPYKDRAHVYINAQGYIRSGTQFGMYDHNFGANNFPKDKYIKISLSRLLYEPGTLNLTMHDDKYVLRDVVKDVIDDFESRGFQVQKLSRPKIQKELDLTPIQTGGIDKETYRFHIDTIDLEPPKDLGGRPDRAKSEDALTFYLRLSNSPEIDGDVPDDMRYSDHYINKRYPHRRF